MKNKIIVPVDFSAQAKNALIYAYDLAAVLGRDLEVVHVDERTSGEPLNTKLAEFCQFINVEDASGLMTKTVVQTTIKKGNATDSIIAISQQSNVAMIVMGTRGEHPAIEKLFGSVSSAVAQLAACPVLLVPEYAKYNDFEQILFASDYQTADEEVIDKIAALGNLFRATLHFIHVVEEENDPGFLELEERIFNYLFKDSEPSFSFNMSAVPAASVMAGIHDYAKKNKIELIVLVNQHRDFVSSILGKKCYQTTSS